MRYFIQFLVLFLLFQPLSSEIEVVDFNKEEQHKRYLQLIDEIRCPVCQGQSIGGSNASLAQDLRSKVKEMILEGKKDAEIVKFMTDRYGDFASFSPPVSKNTYLLWFAPFIFLLIILIIFLKAIKKDTNKKSTKVDSNKIKELLK